MWTTKTDQIARMCRLSSVFVGRMCQKVRFLQLWLFCFIISMFRLHIGYRCYTCSYGLWSDGDRRECIENPESLGHGSRLTCNRTSYCVLQEQYDIRKYRFTVRNFSYAYNEGLDQAANASRAA